MGEEVEKELEFYVAEVDRLHAFSDELGLKLERVERERDEAHRLLDTYGQARTEGEGSSEEVLTLSGRILNLEVDRRAAEAQVEALRKALATLAGHQPAAFVKGDEEVQRWFRASELRAAAKALAALASSTPESGDQP